MQSLRSTVPPNPQWSIPFPFGWFRLGWGIILWFRGNGPLCARVSNFRLFAFLLCPWAWRASCARDGSLMGFYCWFSRARLIFVMPMRTGMLFSFLLSNGWILSFRVCLSPSKLGLIVCFERMIKLVSFTQLLRIFWAFIWTFKQDLIILTQRYKIIYF